MVSLGGVHLGLATNNIVEYSVIFELLSKALALGICRLVFKMDSHILVSQLNHTYSVIHPMLLHKYLMVCLLERYFEYIDYCLVIRGSNMLDDLLDNCMLE